jgi:hypothetical protein
MKNPVTNEKLIYQYGNALEPNYVFFKGAFEKNIETNLKTVYQTSSYIDGDSDLLVNSRAKKTAYEIECTFSNVFNSSYDRNFINRVFNGSKKTTFYFDYTYDPTLPVYTNRQFGKVYFHRTRTIKTPNQSEGQYEDIEKVQLDDTILLKSDRPYFYDISDCVEYLDYETYIASLTTWNGTTWSDSSTFWKYPPSSYGLVSSLSNADKLNYFTNLAPNGINYFMYLRDRFFERDTSQTVRRYIIDETQNSNSTGDYTTTNDLLNASADTDIFRIELSQMSAGQSIQVINTTNDSGLTITWADTVSSDAVLVYNNYTKKLYETSNETEIASNKYTVTIPDSSGQPLYFSGLLNPYRIGDPSFEIVRLINSTGTNLDVKIDVLPAYD